MMIKPISGSWFEFQHYETAHPDSAMAEGRYWNRPCREFTDDQWKAKITEMSEIGFEYLVLMSVALHGRAFYETESLPRYGLAATDPIEAVLAAADESGMKFFIGAGFFGTWETAMESSVAADRHRAIEEIARRYAHHRSFHGFYWPKEEEIGPYFSDEYINYVRGNNRVAKLIVPDAKILIAPYGTNKVQPDDTYARQLEMLGCDYVAYQDEVGVQKSGVDDTERYYAGLRAAHDKVPQCGLWADVEVFEFEGEVYTSALLPAPFSRIQRQLQAVSPYVDLVLIYQYPGLMNSPDTKAFAGHASSTRLYEEYAAWLISHQPGGA
jgi:uncharacterized protein DUF4434